jgi:hypothetical protein
MANTRFSSGELVTADKLNTVNPSIISTGGSEARTLADRAAAIANVLDFGADNTGATDAKADIENAITFCSSNNVGVLYFPAGTYSISGRITLNTELLVVGDGRSNTTITTAGDTSIFNINENITVRDMSLTHGVTDFATGATFSLEHRTAFRLTVENVYMSGASYDGIYVANAAADLIVRDCESDNYGRLSLAVTEAKDVVIDGFKGESAELTALGDWMDFEPNAGKSVQSVHLSRVTNGVSIWEANGPVRNTVIENCDLDVLNLKGNSSGTGKTTILGSDVADWTDQYGTFIGGTISIIDPVKTGTNLIPDSRTPGTHDDFWNLYYSPTIVEDYTEFDSTGSTAESSSIDTADRIAVTAGDIISFGGEIRRIAGATANNLTGIYITVYDSTPTALGTFALSAISTVGTDFFKQNHIFKCPTSAASIGMTIGVGTITAITIGVKNVFLYKDTANTDYVDGVLYQDIRNTAAPSAGYHYSGERVLDVTPSAGGTAGWICTASGTPGTWKTFGTIAS